MTTRRSSSSRSPAWSSRGGRGGAMRFSTFHSFAIHAGAGGVTDAELSSSFHDVAHGEAIWRELERIRLADDLGFDTVWLREHHFTDYGFLANTMVMAG